ncbi:complement C1q-like protein 3 [Magallana gigas]|uniref:complement C1q-like protein 3 n=1 Tax=Magallana gigas TaxID=29159 RepID=UPI00333F1646
MTWTILTLVFAAICLSLSMADEMKLMKNEIAVIRNLLREQNKRLTRLEMENDALKITVTKLENDNLLMKDRLVNISDENEALKQEVSDLRRHVTTIQEYSNIENLDKQEEPSGAFRETAVHRRLLLSDAGSPSTTPLPVEPVAFYAYMSKSEPTPSNHHALVFDVLKTNLGNGYNKYSGTFVAPYAGTYVFTWTININPHGAHWINLMVNDAVVGGTLADTQVTGDFDSDSNTAVVVLSQGDSVILRTTSASDTANIHVDSRAFTTFAGWRL